MCISMSKSFYEKINLLLFVQYESEHVMPILNILSGLGYINDPLYYIWKNALGDP